MAKVLALTGGVGGAKLVRGLAQLLPSGQLSVLANTADDFDIWGLRICPDLDSVMYALADQNDTQRGWGLENESWRVLDEMRRYGAEGWFQLGDRDLATHLFRTQLLRGGGNLTDVTRALCRAKGIDIELLPMTDQPVSTTVVTTKGVLGFQEYFVRERCQPEVRSIHFVGASEASLNPDIVALLQSPNLSAVVLCPSNPFLSVDPILSLPGAVALLSNLDVPVVAVSPIVAGMAIKGPAAKMMAELEMPVTAVAVAQYYQTKYPGLLSGFIVDSSDARLAPEVGKLGLGVGVYPTVMTDLDSKATLAECCLAFADSLTQ